jgi:hypothetical protein
MVPVPLAGFGQVAYGFQRIYQTLRVVDFTHAEALTAEAPTKSLEPAGTFAHQVADGAVRHHAAMAATPSGMATRAPSATMSIEVAGHSLGAALATLYVAQNAATGSVATPLICTFASPRVGDFDFATKFDQLGNTSWRIVNELDIVPNLPFLGFWHVAKEYPYNSGSSVEWTLSCWHSLSTYLHLLDPKQPLPAGCSWTQRPLAAAALRPVARLSMASPALGAAPEKEIALSVPSASINISIKVGGTA